VHHTSITDINFRTYKLIKGKIISISEKLTLQKIQIHSRPKQLPVLSKFFWSGTTNMRVKGNLLDFAFFPTLTSLNLNED
jgi:hypothetical protein